MSFWFFVMYYPLSKEHIDALIQDYDVKIELATMITLNRWGLIEIGKKHHFPNGGWGNLWNRTHEGDNLAEKVIRMRRKNPDWLPKQNLPRQSGPPVAKRKRVSFLESLEILKKQNQLDDLAQTYAELNGHDLELRTYTAYGEFKYLSCKNCNLLMIVNTEINKADPELLFHGPVMHQKCEKS